MQLKSVPRIDSSMKANLLEEQIRLEVNRFFIVVIKESNKYLSRITAKRIKNRAAQNRLKFYPKKSGIKEKLVWILKKLFFFKFKIVKLQMEQHALKKTRKKVKKFSQHFRAIQARLFNEDIDFARDELLKMSSIWYTQTFPEKQRKLFFHLPADVRLWKVNYLLGRISEII